MMTDTLLGALGKPSTLNGQPALINIEHGVQIAGYGSEQAASRGDYIAQRDVATIGAEHNPQQGQSFVQDGNTYRLEALLQDRGYSRRFVIQKVRTP